MDVALARRLFSYNPSTGHVTWRVSNGRSVRSGDRAGCFDCSNGYRRIGYRGTFYSEHRIVWMLHYGENPPPVLDHANRVRHDNRVVNLRPASPAENASNRSILFANKSGVAGVYWSAEHKKWKAQISVKGKRLFLGLHDDISDARTARLQAERLHFGAFSPANQNISAAVVA